MTVYGFTSSEAVRRVGAAVRQIEAGDVPAGRGAPPIWFPWQIVKTVGSHAGETLQACEIYRGDEPDTLTGSGDEIDCYNRSTTEIPDDTWAIAVLFPHGYELLVWE